MLVFDLLHDFKALAASGGSWRDLSAKNDLKRSSSSVHLGIFFWVSFLVPAWITDILVVCIFVIEPASFLEGLQH